jgi:outer membrane protein TolC
MIGEIQVMQMIPWIDRLRAEGRQAHLEALAAENDFQAEKLRVLGDVRATWARLFVIQKQIETTLADTAQIESLVRTANARVSTGAAPVGDVLLATLELSSLHEQLITLRRELVSASAALNVLVGRQATCSVAPVHVLHSELPDWDTDLLLHVAMNTQPELAAARLRSVAARYGIDVARLRRRPDFTFSGGWVPMDAPGSTMPGAGADVATIGVSTNLPFRRVKYEAMHTEAARQHAAARSSEDEIRLRLESAIVDVWAQATAARQIVDLYDHTILPQARQTYAADLQALENGTVDFDRVVRDYRALLTMELGRHRAAGELAIAVARVQQAVGADADAIPRVTRTPK